MLIVSFSVAQDGIEYPVDDFSELKVFDGISVKLIPGKENRVVIKGEDARSVTVRLVRGKLKIRMEMEKLFSGYATFAEVYYNSPLSVLDVNENALITSDEVIDQVDLELRAQEAGEIDLEVQLKRLRIKSVTGATISVKGAAKNQVVDVNTGGGYEAGNLETEQTEVEVNAGGYADIRASEYVDATVRAGGNINIYGKPRVIDRTKFLGGTIKEL
jgi:hypothetical protein